MRDGPVRQIVCIRDRKREATLERTVVSTLFPGFLPAPPAELGHSTRAI